MYVCRMILELVECSVYCGSKEGRHSLHVKLSYSSHYRLPDYACKFLEICLMVSADHGPAVSGAHNTIVTARAGKDLVSSLTSGLLTIVSTGMSLNSVLPLPPCLSLLGGQVWWGTGWSC